MLKFKLHAIFMGHEICGGTPKPRNLFIKNCVFFSYMFILQTSSKCTLFDATDPSRQFFHCSKQFLNSSILMPFSASAIFCFTSSTSAKCFPLRISFIQGNKAKVAVVEIEWIGRVRHGGHAGFWSKIAQHSAWCRQVRWQITHHEMGKRVKKKSSKLFHWSWTQPLITMSAGTLI